MLTLDFYICSNQKSNAPLYEKFQSCIFNTNLFIFYKVPILLAKSVEWPIYPAHFTKPIQAVFYPQ